MKKNLALILLFSAVTALGLAQQDTTLNIQEVVVTGSQVKVSRNHLPQTISVITRDEIESSSESALLPVLSERVPGVFVSERGVTGFGVSNGSAGSINIRGIGSGNRVLTMFDGQPQWAGVFGHSLPDTYVASDVERVEVIRGPASMLYGSNAMGGVVNIITRGQNREGWHGQARASYGTFHTQKYLVNTGYKQGKFNLFASVNHDRTEGHRVNSRFWITNGYAKLGYEFSRNWKATADVTLAKYYAENPGPESAPMIDGWADVLRGTVSASVENNYEKTSGAIKAFYNFGNHEINDGHTADKPALDYLFQSRDHVAGFVAYQSVRLFTGNTLTGGVDFKNWGGRAWNEYKTEDKPIIDKTVNETAVYAQMQQSLFDKLSLSAGVRLEMNQTYGSEWVPQAGLSYHPWENTTFKASYSKGFRSPNIRELYMWGPANPDLLPERVQNYDITVMQSLLGGRMTLELTGFVANGDNLISTITVDKKPKNVNIGRFNNKGVEFAINYKILKNLSAMANYSYLSMDNPIPAAPKHQAFVGADYTLKKVTLNLHYQLVDGMYRTPAKDSPTESYYLINAKVTYRPIHNLALYIKGENLTDQRYSILQGYSMPGITVLGGVSVSF